MKNLMRVFIVTVLAADLFAIVYFSGHFATTGHLLPEHGKAEMNPVLAALAPETAEAGEGAAAKHDDKPVDVDALLVAGDPAIGAKIANKCKACHTFEKGGPNKTGPNLWGVVGSKVAHRDDFSYTASFAKKHEAGETWKPEMIFEFLASPKDYMPGTKMSLSIRKPEERAHIIAYLKTLKD